MPWLLERRERLEAFRRADRTTLEAVYAEYAPKVASMLRTGFSSSGDGGQHRFRGFTAPFDIDDALQETFLRAFSPRAREAYDGVRPFGTYVLTIARNLVISRLRRDKTSAAAMASSSDVDVETRYTDANNPDPEQHSMQLQLKRLLHDFKASLSPDDLLLFRMRFEQGLTRASVTEATGLSAMQIRTREERLRQHLHKRLSKTGYTSHLGAIVIALLLLMSRGG
jgi:RNA polymerase sigma factor (sigma-70 family)